MQRYLPSSVDAANYRNYQDSEETDLYDKLLRETDFARQRALMRLPDLNHAVAVGMAEGPEVALAIVDRLVREPALKAYHLLPSVRGDLLHKLGRYEEARAAFEAAAALAGNRREHDLLRRRAAEAADAALSS